MCVDEGDNELEVLDIIHHFVEILDRYFGSVSLLPTYLPTYLLPQPIDTASIYIRNIHSPFLDFLPGL